VAVLEGDHLNILMPDLWDERRQALEW
jgi:hypothetical protein